jgi:hypothetical protein
MILREGGSMGDIYVNTLKTDEHGYIVVGLTTQAGAEFLRLQRFIHAHYLFCLTILLTQTGG